MKKEFYGTCVSNPFGDVKTLVGVISNAKEITREEFIECCFISQDLKIEMNERPNDFKFARNGDIYIFVWSGIEHFYL